MLQEIRRRWAQLSDDCRELIADAVASLKLHTEGQQQQLLPQLHLALDAAGETWHTGIAESSGSGAGSNSPGAAVVAKWQQRAAQACEELSAASASSPEAPSQMLQRPLSLLALGYIGGAPLKVGAAQRGMCDERGAGLTIGMDHGVTLLCLRPLLQRARSSADTHHASAAVWRTPCRCLACYTYPP